MDAPAPIPRPVRRRNEKGRRCWSQREEEVLLAGLKEIITHGWKSDNGFRVGYLQALEAYIAKEFPGTDLKASPHINSKIHGWKKAYGSLFSMLVKSGIGWNVTTKMIEASDEAWESYVKVDINAKGIGYKSWPYYEEWCEVFGRDRATGGEAEGFTAAVNDLLNDTQDVNASSMFESYDKTLDVNDADEDNMSVSQPAQSSAAKKGKGKKRRTTDTTDPICEILGDFCKRTDARLGEIASRIGHEFDMAAAKKEVWSVMETFDSLMLSEKLIASSLLVGSNEQLVLFFTLPMHAREEFVRLKLLGRC